MNLHNSFDLPLPPEAALPVLLDIPRIMPCMPGAELTEVVDERTYKAKCGVKLGPVTLSFDGIATFEEIDSASCSARFKAQGTDSKGRGGAAAVVTFRLEPLPGGSKVLVDTQLDLSGSIAQYGRGAGMIQSVASQLIGQFAKNLEAELHRISAVAAATAIADPAILSPSSAAPSGVVLAPPTLNPAKPISGFALLWAALLDVLRGLFVRRKS